MKNLNLVGYIFVLAIFSFTSCNTTKNLAYSPVGTWDYTIANTPMGDLKGELVLMKEGDKLVGEITSDQGKEKIEDITLTDKNILANFSALGYGVKLEGAFEGESLSGTINTQGFDFPITAVRKSQ